MLPYPLGCIQDILDSSVPRYACACVWCGGHSLRPAVGACVRALLRAACVVCGLRPYAASSLLLYLQKKACRLKHYSNNWGAGMHIHLSLTATVRLPYMDGQHRSSNPGNAHIASNVVKKCTNNVLAAPGCNYVGASSQSWHRARPNQTTS